MTDETQGATPLTQEQEQRLYAATAAGDLLRGREAAKGPLSAAGMLPGRVPDIVDLADYIVTGDTYCVNVQRRKRMANPSLLVVQDLLTSIFVEPDAPAEGDGKEDANPFD